MIRYRCDGCGLDLEQDGSNHYILKVEAFAAAGHLEFTEQDLERDHEGEIRRILSELQDQHPDEIEDQVYRLLRYDLCPHCHRKFLDGPLAAIRPRDKKDD
jgi:hypothetical protein